jgi:hypothetical protein
MPRTGTVISHWHALIDDFNTSALDFYTAVEEAVRTRAVPDTVFSRVEYREGGFASAKRLYLRIERGKVTFDVCAAPYGTGFFFSWWLARLGPKNPLLLLAAFLLVLALGSHLLASAFDDPFAYLLFLPVMPVVLIVALAFLARQEVFGPEEDIIAIPVIGWIYDKIFHPITYYSHDTALMFQESVRRAVNDTIDGLMSAQGLRALTEAEKQPTIRDLTPTR